MMVYYPNDITKIRFKIDRAMCGDCYEKKVATALWLRYGLSAFHYWARPNKATLLLQRKKLVCCDCGKKESK